MRKSNVRNIKKSNSAMGKYLLVLMVSSLMAVTLTGCDFVDKCKETLAILQGDEDAYNSANGQEPLITYGDENGYNQDRYRQQSGIDTGFQDTGSTVEAVGNSPEISNNGDDSATGNISVDSAGAVGEDEVGMLQEQVVELTEDEAANLDEAKPLDKGEELSLEDKLSAERYYAYSTLSDGGKKLYRLMYDNFMNHGGKLQMPTLNMELIDKVFACVLADNPELFYIKGYNVVKAQRGGVTQSVAVSAIYTMTSEEADFHQKNADEYVRKCLAGMPKTSDDYEKIKYLYEYIVKNCEYDLAATNSQNFISVYENGRSVCQGYSNALQYLMINADMFCTVVRGTAKTGENHAWNLVKSNGDYYYVDVTWGDASYDTTADPEMAALPSLPEVNYEYLCVTTPMLERGHRIDNDFPVPFCSATKDYYFIREGNYFEYVDTNRLNAVFDKAYSEGADKVTIKCSDQAVFNQMEKYLTNDSHIFDYLRGSKNVNYVTLQESDELIFYL